MSKSAAAERLPTFAELYLAIEALPPGLTGEILEPGLIRTMARPGAAHRFATRGIPRSLGGDDAVEGGAWWLEQEAEVRLLGDRLVVPDLAGWRLTAEETRPPACIADNPIERRPDWCCEVLSPSTEAIDRETKVPLHARAGVEWIWLVDPRTRRIEVLRTAGAEARPIEIVVGDARRAIPPFESELDTSRWWLPTP